MAFTAVLALSRMEEGRPTKPNSGSMSCASSERTNCANALTSAADLMSSPVQPDMSFSMYMYENVQMGHVLSPGWSISVTSAQVLVYRLASLVAPSVPVDPSAAPATASSVEGFTYFSLKFKSAISPSPDDKPCPLSMYEME